MIDSQIHVAIKSYKRAGAVKTLKVVPFAYIWVPESQGDEYRSYYGDRVITIPDSEDGNLSRKQNAILDRTPCPWTVILDDDITRIGHYENGDHIWLDPDGVRDLIIRGFILAHDLGVELWGLNQNHDPMCYRIYAPIHLLAPILGPFHGHLSPTLRYDEAAGGKDDYDFWLQNIRTHRKTLRLTKYHYVHDHGSAPGGFVSMRTMAKEQEDVDRLLKKWGSKLIRPGGSAGGNSATGENILNTKIKVPIPGC